MKRWWGYSAHVAVWLCKSLVALKAASSTKQRARRRQIMVQDTVREAVRSVYSWGFGRFRFPWPDVWIIS